MSKPITEKKRRINIAIFMAILLVGCCTLLLPGESHKYKPGDLVCYSGAQMSILASFEENGGIYYDLETVDGADYNNIPEKQIRKNCGDN